MIHLNKYQRRLGRFINGMFSRAAIGVVAELCDASSIAKLVNLKEYTFAFPV